MTMAGELILPNFPENLDVCGVPAKGSPELHVLAVDDSHVDRKVIEKLLKRLSCKVTAVDSGLSALQFLGLDGDKSSVGFDDLKINLIMTDYSMPGMTGFELLKKIKESSAFRETPVVIMSSERILARIERCMEEGAKEFLAKPVKLSDVERLMNFVMRGGDVCQGSRINSSKRGLDDDSAGGSNHHHAPSTTSLPLSLPHGCDAAASCSPSSSDCSVLLPTSTSLSTAKKVRIQ